MGHPTFAELLDQLIFVRDASYRNDIEASEARFRALESTMQSLLEKLRDTEERWP